MFRSVATGKSVPLYKQKQEITFYRHPEKEKCLFKLMVDNDNDMFSTVHC
jgi:hypothetical protein